MSLGCYVLTLNAESQGIYASVFVNKLMLSVIVVCRILLTLLPGDKDNIAYKVLYDLVPGYLSIPSLSLSSSIMPVQ